MPAKGSDSPTLRGKILGLFLIILLPILGFFLGIRSQPFSDVSYSVPTPPPTATPTPQRSPFSGSFEIGIAGAEAMLTDQQGRRTGYDKKTQSHLTEIPESMYFDSKIIPPGGADNGKVMRNLILANTAGGFYDLEIIAPTTALGKYQYDLVMVGYDPNYIQLSASASGDLNPETIQKYHIDFDPGEYLQIRSLEQ